LWKSKKKNKYLLERMVEESKKNQPMDYDGWPFAARSYHQFHLDPLLRALNHSNIINKIDYIKCINQKKNVKVYIKFFSEKD
jgi:hypothetical protein